MKKIFSLLLFICLAVGHANATVTTGLVTFKDTALTNGSVQFKLLGCANPLLNSSSGAAALSTYTFKLDANGNIPTSAVSGNDIIYCSGVTGNTYYEVKASNQAGALIWDRYYRVTGFGWNISTASPLTNFSVGTYVLTNSTGDQIVNIPLNNRLSLVGGQTFIQQLQVGQDPVASNDVATKNYVDTVGTSSANLQAINNKISRSGDSMTGPLVLASDPTINLQAATKQYVDNSISTSTPSGATSTYRGTVQLATGQSSTILSKVASTGTYSDLSGTPSLGSLSGQNSNSVSITGGTISAATVFAGGSPVCTYDGSNAVNCPPNSGGGSVPALTQYSLAAYTGTPSGGNATLAKFNATTDASGNNLTVAGAFAAKQISGINSALAYEAGGNIEQGVINAATGGNRSVVQEAGTGCANQLNGWAYNNTDYSQLTEIGRTHVIYHGCNNTADSTLDTSGVSHEFNAIKMRRDVEVPCL
jgi:hypothetical protein